MAHGACLAAARIEQMTAERWQQIKTTFHAVCERPSAERAQFLQEVCAGDAELRREVESLLATDERAGSFINHPLLGHSATLAGTEPPQPELAGTPELA